MKQQIIQQNQLLIIMKRAINYIFYQKKNIICIIMKQFVQSSDKNKNEASKENPKYIQTQLKQMVFSQLIHSFHSFSTNFKYQFNRNGCFYHIDHKSFSNKIYFNQQMGNVDFSSDQKLMQKHGELVSLFGQERPLFNSEDVKFPLSTEGIKIVDATGRRVKLAGGNWSGAHMCRHCVDGLQCRPMRDIAMDIRYKFKMNCIRLTYSLQMFYDNKPVPDKYLKANPELRGKTGMQIFDITVNTLTEVGLMVILNNHTSSSQWCCSNQDGDGLWWSREFPQYKFFESSEIFAKKYSNNPLVIGMDLRNQLRKANGLQTTWGDGNPLTDWHRAATICGQKVLKIAPHWLIFVSGVNYQLDLTGVHKTTIQYSVPNKLVYTGHFYGFSWPIPSWSLVSYEEFKKKLFNSQTFVRGLGYPFFLGQYGNNCKDIPWNYLIRYLKETDIDWTYWALDGFKCQQQTDETYGVFTNDFSGARHPSLLEDMISVGPPQGTVIQPSQRQNINRLTTQNTPVLKGYKPQVQQIEARQQQYQPQNIGPIQSKFLLSMTTSTTRQEPQISNIKPPGQFLQNQNRVQQPTQGWNYQVEQKRINQNRFTAQTQGSNVPQYAGGFTGKAAYNPPQVQVGQQGQSNLRMVSQPIPQGPNLYNPNLISNQPLIGNYQAPNNQGYIQPTNQPIYQQQLNQGQGNNQNPQQQQLNPKNVVYFDSNGRPILR